VSCRVHRCSTCIVGGAFEYVSWNDESFQVHREEDTIAVEDNVQCSGVEDCHALKELQSPAYCRRIVSQCQEAERDIASIYLYTVLPVEVVFSSMLKWALPAASTVAVGPPYWVSTCTSSTSHCQAGQDYFGTEYRTPHPPTHLSFGRWRRYNSEMGELLALQS